MSRGPCEGAGPWWSGRGATEEASGPREAIADGRTSLGIEFGSTRTRALLIGADHAAVASGSHSKFAAARSFLARRLAPGELTSGTDNWSRFPSRDLRKHPSARGDHPPTRRLPRPRVPGHHRVLVRPVREVLRLARRAGGHRRGPAETAACIDTYRHDLTPGSATAPPPRPSAHGPTPKTLRRPDPSTSRGPGDLDRGQGSGARVHGPDGPARRAHAPHHLVAKRLFAVGGDGAGSRR